MADSKIIHKVLKQYWGYDSFRPLQEDIILSVLEGRDSLALLPTGGGKSICFQVPALVNEGLCLVVSPLISLMQDQVDNLLEKGIKAASISSAISRREIDVLLDNCIYGGIKFLYLSPERLKSELFLERLKKMKVSLLAIDEAHCISQWGYDFRPEYLQIAEIREQLPKVPVLALTATATPEVVKDIQVQLKFKKKLVFQKSFVRPNLAYVVLHEDGKLKRLLKIITNIGGSGIVYLRSRNKTGLVAKELKKRGISCESYHAGLQQSTRKQRQQQWIDGDIQAIAATNAFGMGIDKPDVRWVVHLDLPDSLEAYFQEAGRAGRDGKKSYSVVLYDDADILDLRKRVEQAFPSIKEIRLVYKALGNFLQVPYGAGKERQYNFDMVAFASRYGFGTRDVYNALKILENEEFIKMSDAFHHPSKVMIKLQRKGIYEYSIQKNDMSKLLDMLLRSHAGLFDSLVKINESTLAKRLKWDNKKLREQLQKLKKRNAIEYIPQSNSPQIYFVCERLPEENLSIDKKRYSFRKARAFKNVEAVVSYLEEGTCRSTKLVHYFGQKNAPPCGQCDYCLEQKKRNNRKDIHQLVEAVRALLALGALPLNELPDKISGFSKEQIYMCVEWLEDSGEIVIENEEMSLA